MTTTFTNVMMYYTGALYVYIFAQICIYMYACVIIMRIMFSGPVVSHHHLRLSSMIPLGWKSLQQSC